jgi:hypothetical protein
MAFNYHTIRKKLLQLLFLCGLIVIMKTTPITRPLAEFMEMYNHTPLTMARTIGTSRQRVEYWLTKNMAYAQFDPRDGTVKRVTIESRKEVYP